jgi:hypothetical protein
MYVCDERERMNEGRLKKKGRKKRRDNVQRTREMSTLSGIYTRQQ